MKAFQPEKMIRIKDGGNSFLDEIDEEMSRPASPGAPELNAAYGTNTELLGDLMIKEFDIFEVVINKFNMQTANSATNHGCFSQ